MESTIRVLICTVLLSVLGCGQQADQGPRAEQDDTAAREGISKALRSWEEVWKNGDSAAAAAKFTDDAINMMPGAESDVGRAAIERAFEEFLSSVTINEITFTTQELDVRGDKAYELGNFVQQYTDGETEVTQRSRYMAFWKLEADGQWRYHRFLFNNLPAANAIQE
jgi:uncharacterized protein (TIGR02246 family)